MFSLLLQVWFSQTPYCLGEGNSEINLLTDILTIWVEVILRGKEKVFVRRVLSNSNWTEWSTIQGVIERVISKSDKCEADLKLRARLLPELYDMRSNY